MQLVHFISHSLISQVSKYLLCARALLNPIPNGEQSCLSEVYSAVREMTLQGDLALGADSAQLYSHGHLGVTIY